MSRVKVTSDCPEIKPFTGNSNLVLSYSRPATGCINWYFPHVWVDADNNDRSGWFDHRKVEEVTERPKS